MSLAKTAVPIISLILILFDCSPATAAEQVTFQSGQLKLNGYLCRPPGPGPFPLVVYNHGGLGDIIGGPPEETCEALAKEGYVGFSPIRRKTKPMRDHVLDVMSGLDYAIALNFIIPQRVALIGFSRGGLLTYIVGSTGYDLKALVIMATAFGKGPKSRVLNKAKDIKAPALVLVAQNDTGSNRTMGMNTLEGSKEMVDALKKAGNTDVQFIIYPPYGDDGHTLFFTVGNYWHDIVVFLNKHLL